MTDITFYLRNAGRAASSIVAFLATLGFLLTAYQYDPRRADFPLIVGWTTLALCVLDLIACTPTAIGQRLTALLHRQAVAETDAKPAILRELQGISWVCVIVVLVVLLGFLVALPVYIFAFMTLYGRNPPVRSALIAGITDLVIYAVFEWLLRYEVYRGVFFG